MKPYVPIFVPLLLTALSASLFAASLAPRPKVMVHDSGLAHSNFITLGDIADISPSPRASKASARLAAAVIGRAPMDGATRSFNRGDISLKLRQCGIDPETINFQGASTTVVASTNDGSPNPTPATPSQAQTTSVVPEPSSASQIVVHAGDPVDVLVADGPVTVHASAVALGSGAAGQSIRVRREGSSAESSSQPFPVTVIGAGQTQLEE